MRCQTKVVLFTAAIAARLIDENGPELVAIVALARIAGSAMRARGLPVLPILLSAKVSFLLAFFVLAVVLGRFPIATRQRRC